MHGTLYSKSDLFNNACQVANLTNTRENSSSQTVDAKVAAGQATPYFSFKLIFANAEM